MQGTRFYRFGELVYRFRWHLIILWVIVVLACIPFLPNIISPFTTTGFVDEHSESAQAERYLNKEFAYDKDNKIVIIYHSKTLIATRAAFQNKIKESLKELKNFPIKHEIILPESNKKFISKDKHTAYAVIILKSHASLKDKELDLFKTLVKTPKGMTLTFGERLSSFKM